MTGTLVYRDVWWEYDAVGLRDVADRDTVEAAVQAWHAEGARLLKVRREVGLVEEALRGRRFVARL